MIGLNRGIHAVEISFFLNYKPPFLFRYGLPVHFFMKKINQFVYQ